MKSKYLNNSNFLENIIFLKKNLAKNNVICSKYSLDLSKSNISLSSFCGNLSEDSNGSATIFEKKRAKLKLKTRYYYKKFDFLRDLVKVFLFLIKREYILELKQFFYTYKNDENLHKKN